MPSKTVKVSPQDEENDYHRPSIQQSKSTRKLGKGLDSKKRISDSNKKDVRKREAFTLPSTEKRNSVKPVTSKAADPDFIFKEERLQMYHKSSLDIELDEEEVAELVEHELEIQEYKRTHKWKHYMLSFAAKADVFAAAHTMPKHQVCIFVAFALIPLSIITITWDLLATQVFQIPHLSTISAPAFILVINFIAMPLAMYGYMMEYLMYENSREAIIACICVVVHPILFLTRAFMEYHFDGFRSEVKLYFENPEQGDSLEYPVGVLTSTEPLTLV